MADTCTGGTVACWISSQVNILNNIANNLLPVERLITGAAYLIGCAFLFKGVYCLKQYGEQRTMMSSNTNAKEPITYLLVGTMLIYFPTTFATFMQSSFGYLILLPFNRHLEEKQRNYC